MKKKKNKANKSENYIKPTNGFNTFTKGNQHSKKPHKSAATRRYRGQR